MDQSVIGNIYIGLKVCKEVGILMEVEGFLANMWG